MFTLPKVYETNKQNIDQYLDLVRSKIVEITEKWVSRHAIDCSNNSIKQLFSCRVKAAIPIGKKDESPKDK